MSTTATWEVVEPTRTALQSVAWSLQQASSVAYDIETTGLNPYEDKPLLLQFAIPGQAWVLIVNQHKHDNLVKLLTILSKREVIAHNVKFEMEFTRVHFGVNLERVWDTQVAEAVLTAGLQYRVGLGPTVTRRLGIKLDKEEQTSFIGANPDTFVPTESQLEYAVLDVLLLHDLQRIQQGRINYHVLVPTVELEMSLIPALADMELSGMLLDIDKHNKVLEEYREQYATAQDNLVSGELGTAYKLMRGMEYTYKAIRYRRWVEFIAANLRHSKTNPTGKLVRGDRVLKGLYWQRDYWKPKPVEPLNLGSHVQLKEALRLLDIDIPDTKKQTLKDNEAKHPILSVLLKWKEAAKVLSSFGESLQAFLAADGRIKGSYNQIVSTGRMSSRRPNMQQMPKKIRACFVPAPGNVYIVADFSQMELRIAAGMSNDRAMIRAFREGIDLHRLTAAVAWPLLYKSWEEVPKDGEHRQFSKSSNFAKIYGGSAYALVYRGLVPDMATAERVGDAFTKAFPVANRWVASQGPAALRDGYVRTALGRKRRFRPAGDKPTGPGSEEAQQEWVKRRRRIMRQAMNHPVQGTGADITKYSMVLIRERLKYGNLVASVHDEVLAEVPFWYADEAKEIIAAAMVEAGARLVRGIDIPAEVHVVQRWEK